MARDPRSAKRVGRSGLGNGSEATGKAGAGRARANGEAGAEAAATRCVSSRSDDDRSDLVYGEIEGTLLMTLGEDGKLTRLNWQATARELLLAAFQGKVPANPFLPLTGWLNMELWGEWSKSDGHLIKGVSDVRDAILVNEYQDLALERFNSRFQWQFADKGKRLF